MAVPCLAEPPGAVREREAGARLERAALEGALKDVREALVARPAMFADEAAVRAAVDARWGERLVELDRPALGPVVNATGVVVHTNLGRAQLAPSTLDAVAGAAGYTALEFDLARGERGSRYAHATGLLRLATGAEDALVVNNNAAALVLVVAGLADGRGVAVSRGELLEIGGGFRIHEILARAGARIVEVGATNKTRVEDYERALDEDDVGLLLKVHRSNFEVRGFVAEASLGELARLAAERGVRLAFDQGTGLLDPLGLAPGEPTVRGALDAGADVVTASGDKLLGGPQAGIVCGRESVVTRLRTDPLLRALRVDKVTLATLEATLRLALEDPDATPVRRMLTAKPAELELRARALRADLAPAARDMTEVVPHAGRAGGGTLPGVDLPGWALKVVPRGGSAATLATALRVGQPPIVARVADGAVWLDVRTFSDAEARIVARRLEGLLTRGGVGEGR